MQVLGRVQRGTGQGKHYQTLAKPIPIRGVGGIPAGFPNMDFAKICLCWWGLYHCTVPNNYLNSNTEITEHYLWGIQSIHPKMSFSTSDSSTIPMRRKHTISECVIENGDPLAIRKKAHEAARQGPSALVTSQAVPAPPGASKPGQVCLKPSDNVNISWGNRLPLEPQLLSQP